MTVLERNKKYDIRGVGHGPKRLETNICSAASACPVQGTNRKINIEMFEVQFWIYIQTINKIFLSVRKTIYSTFSIPEISTIGAHRKPYKNSKNNNVICGAINE